MTPPKTVPQTHDYDPFASRANVVRQDSRYSQIRACLAREIHYDGGHCTEETRLPTSSICIYQQRDCSHCQHGDCCTPTCHQEKAGKARIPANKVRRPTQISSRLSGQGWSWEQSAIPVMQRRQLNGKYRFFMDEEIHQALLVHYIGAQLARGPSWHTTNGTAMTEEDTLRRAYFLRETTRQSGQVVPSLKVPSRTLDNIREALYDDNYFLIQLPHDLESGTRDYTGGDSDDVSTEKTPVELKQELMELITADMLVDLETSDEFCVIQSGFTWFGPSLPHATIFELLQFFGFKQYFINFCKAFLEAPLVFAQDGPDAVPTTRKAGAPMSHALSDVLGEMLLFCLDHAVNLATKGRKLFRLHDDLWFWGTGADCETAWQTIQEFTLRTGLKLNAEKSGSCFLTGDRVKADSIPPPSSLPEGKIKWGFLVLSPTTRKWEINLTQVHDHISELRLQLSACHSVLAFIQAWNSYVSRFFTTNFGRAANCHGNSHLRSVISTFELIQRELFPSGSVTSHLKTMIATRFSIPADTIPTGFLYFPTELGGLDLRNPFIPLLARLHEPPTTDSLSDQDLTENGGVLGHTLEPEDRLRLAALQDRHEYNRAKARFDKEKATFTTIDGWRPADHETFFSFEEYIRFRAETSYFFVAAAEALREHPPEKAVEQTLSRAETRAVDERMEAGWSAKVYSQWILALYGPEMVEMFGGVEVGDRELLPVGLVKMLRGERVRWQG
ncbi:hypothetical protein KVT40_007153 [Elsinoe batatas]|uniref:Reverse transcriptase domain-containing protein n=1 Tax=Elsinoe batatas TaxID=2601811 RepID=A0A8K0KXX1_9PEZI|nr:hypothetical protein KVT40_007153 [Elsinoe batatas]